MKNLTLSVLIAFAVLLTYKESPKGIYQQVKHDMEQEGYAFPYLWYEDIKFFNDRPNLYGVNPSMGSIASNITILVNYNAWIKMNKTQKKLLILHEIIHSVGAGDMKYHCYNYNCIMKPQNIEKWKNANYDEVLKYTMQHHNLYGKVRRNPFRF